jgi:aminopeptidase-like protein
MDQTADAGQALYQLIVDLFPICRSITGDGFRRSLHRLQEVIPLKLHEIPSGMHVFDWIVPKEWNIRDAYIKNARGERIVDFQQSNLHILGYSIPVNRQVTLEELKQHLYSVPEHDDWIPYRTSYYKENWGFCIAHQLLQSLRDEKYQVFIDSSLEDGHLTFGEYYLKGDSEDEFLISCHCCHPSLCNDNLSGMALSAYLARYLSGEKLRYSYRFLFIPGTIGSIAWLSINENRSSRIKHGLVVACVGDPGKMHYKRSRRGDADIDLAVEHVLKHSGQDYELLDFSPYGYDERQYCSPGFNLPVGSLTRTPHGRFAEYHSSADNLDFIRPDSLADSFLKYVQVINVIENNQRFLNTQPKCEPQLGRRGLYSVFGGRKDTNLFEMALLWVLNLSDGNCSLLDIADRAGLQFSYIHEAALTLFDQGLLIEAESKAL